MNFPTIPSSRHNHVRSIFMRVEVRAIFPSFSIIYLISIESTCSSSTSIFRSVAMMMEYPNCAIMTGPVIYLPLVTSRGAPFGLFNLRLLAAMDCLFDFYLFFFSLFVIFLASVVRERENLAHFYLQPVYSLPPCVPSQCIYMYMCIFIYIDRARTASNQQKLLNKRDLNRLKIDI